MALKVIAFVALIAVYSTAKEQTRWSRQISSYTSDISDWVPLSGPLEKELPQIKRQAVAEPRILSEPFPGFIRPTGFSQDGFPSRSFYNAPANRQLYLQSVPSAPQNYLSDQGFSQGLRFGLTQPNFPLSQGFISPQFNFDSVPQLKARPLPSINPVKFENSVKMINPIPAPIKPFITQAPKTKPEIPKYIDGYRAENNSDYNFDKRKLQSLPKIKFEDTNKSKETGLSSNPKVEREEVQLLYMPLESLNRGQFNFRSPLTTAQLLNTEFFNQNQRPNPIIQNLEGEFQRPVKSQDSFNSQEFLTSFNRQLHEMDTFPRFSTMTSPFPTNAPTTPKPKKLKPHQPPLAIFLTQEAKKEDEIKVGDVLNSLKSASTVAVLDSVNPLNAPKVFIGPSSLTPPENFVKFELPYLSNIENIDKKLRQLPFFVAPLSYNTPQGFAKIPFPSPHVGSVVINSLIKDTSSPSTTTTAANVYSNPHPNYYNQQTIYKQEQKPITQKPKISYYSTTSPNINSPNYEQNYYSIEPQSVSSLRPLKESEFSYTTESTPTKSGSYFISNRGNQYNVPQSFPKETNYKPQEPPKTVNIFKPESTTTQRTTITSTTKLPSTYPSQLLETHNPYSINQAFHFSTPLDYHNFFEEYKEPYSTHGKNQSPSSTPIPTTSPSTSTTKLEEEPTQPPTYQPNRQSQAQPNYLQNYSPEIHHENENQNLRYPTYNTNDYGTKTETAPQTEYSHSSQSSSGDNTQTISNTNVFEENTKNFGTQSPTYDNYTEVVNNIPETPFVNIQSTKSSEYNQYDIDYNSQDIHSSTTSTTTTRRTTRTRGRPRYPTTKSDSGEYSTRATVTRRPLRERKPLPPRTRYEPNRITSEKPTRKPFDSSENTTKSSRIRTRGRIQFKPTDTEETYTKRNKNNGKENDLAYQRDVLHQNYPVTLMERTSTADIEAITEPAERGISTNNIEISKNFDTEDAYSNDNPSITEPIHTESKDVPQQFTAAIDPVSETSYVPNFSSPNKEYSYEPQNAGSQDATSYDEVREENYSVQTSPEYKTEDHQYDLISSRPTSPVTEQNVPIYSINDEFQPNKQHDISTQPEGEENTGIVGPDVGQEQEQEENIVETTPSYNRVRVRPGVIRQYHQASTESGALKSERRKPLQAITYRPAFDKRRTTMRIEEIEADLKTKQVHIRPEFKDYKQPVYKPESTTESISTSSTTEATTRRGQFRRRRPAYSTTTENTVTRRTYEVKNRFRGRRPTEKPTEKPEEQVDVTTTTTKNNLYSRYRDRPRLSERYNKKPETETDDQVSEDQDSNYSINRPKYAEPESEHWSPKISKDSFKPFNPNNIAGDTKTETGEVKLKDDELDIITAKNEFEDILISVTPAYNNRQQKKIPDIPPTLEALVEQSKVTKSDSGDNMSTFESMLEEVMKSLEEQDENEYTGNVMKHKGGEIGEIPPERIISSGENYSLKPTTPVQDEVTAPETENTSSPNSTEVTTQTNRRRGFWKRVKKVRPASEEIEVAESQYYSNVVNRLGQSVQKGALEKSGKGNTKIVVTTYKPNYQFLKDFFETDDEDQVDVIPNFEIPKISAVESSSEVANETLPTPKSDIKSTNSTEKVNPGDMDLGTGSPDPTLEDTAYYTEPTESTNADIDRSDGLSLMDYLFGETSEHKEIIKNETTKLLETTPIAKLEAKTEITKAKATTESNYMPDEFTAETANEENVTEMDIQRITRDDSNEYVTEKSVKVETSSVSSFMNPSDVVSTSMSTEVSHETEICFRGRCIKTNKNIL
ncbi:unnamed protein product, partial [Brenthis ino]